MSVMLVKRCGSCKYAKIMPQDVTKRICWGAPPSATIVPGPGGRPAQQMIRPIVSISDDACALYEQSAVISQNLDDRTEETVQ
jgi:hypothetical protein